MNLLARIPLIMILALGAWSPVQAQSEESAKKKAEGKMMECCKAMKEKKRKMMKQMKAQDAQLGRMVANMKDASGDKKIELMATVLDKLVEQRAAMHRRMAKMDQESSRHMMDHMGKAKENMPGSPMKGKMKAGEEKKGAGPDENKTSGEGRPKTPTGILKKEHHLIKKMAEYAGITAKRIREDEVVDLEEVDQLHDFFKHFADECHHAKEEDHLFPMLRKLQVDTVTINLLIKQHEEGRILLGGIAGILEATEGAPAKANRKALAEYLSQYSRLMERHIELENDYLWPKVSQILDKQAKDKLTKKFRQIENGLGEGFHDKYHAQAMKLLKGSGDR